MHEGLENLECQQLDIGLLFPVHDPTMLRLGEYVLVARDLQPLPPEHLLYPTRLVERYHEIAKTDVLPPIYGQVARVPQLSARGLSSLALDIRHPDDGTPLPTAIVGTQPHSFAHRGFNFTIAVSLFSQYGAGPCDQNGSCTLFGQSGAV